MKISFEKFEEGYYGEYKFKDIVALNSAVLDIRSPGERNQKDCSFGNPEYQYCYWCPEKFTENRAYGLCEPCGYHCLQCTYEDYCNICEDGHYVDSHGKCKEIPWVLITVLAFLIMVVVAAVYFIGKHEYKKFAINRREKKMLGRRVRIADKIIGFNK